MTWLFLDRLMVKTTPSEASAIPRIRLLVVQQFSILPEVQFQWTMRPSVEVTDRISGANGGMLKKAMLCPGSVGKLRSKADVFVEYM